MNKKVYIVRIGAVGGLSLAIHLGLWLLLVNIHPLAFVNGASLEKVKAYVQVKAIGTVQSSERQHILKRTPSDSIIVPDIVVPDIVQRERAKPHTRPPRKPDYRAANSPSIKEPSIMASSLDQPPELAAIENRSVSSGEASSVKGRGASLDLSSIVTPEFTDEALTVGLEGVFEVEIWVNEQGKVEQAKLRQPIGFGMETNLLEAVQLLRFTPATNRYGVAIADHLIIPYSLKRMD